VKGRVEAQVAGLRNMTMAVGLLTLELHLAEAQSLKDKRQVLRSLKDRLRAHFNVAVAELDFEDTWQRSVVGVVTLSNEEHHVEDSLQKVLAEADRILGPMLVSHAVDLL
jgi:uncharacterized protein YlxP (DUF503 family)